jgi:hypothetical protein
MINDSSCGLLSLTVHNSIPTTLDDIKNCRQCDNYTSPIDVLELYRPCNRPTALKIWKNYKATHVNMDIAVYKLVPPNGKRRVKSECVLFDIILDILKTNCPYQQEENDGFQDIIIDSFEEEIIYSSDFIQDKPDRLIDQEKVYNLIENKFVELFELLTNNCKTDPQKELEIIELKMQQQKEQYEYKMSILMQKNEYNTAILERTHKIHLIEEKLGIGTDSWIIASLKAMKLQVDLICDSL